MRGFVSKAAITAPSHVDHNAHLCVTFSKTSAVDEYYRLLFLPTASDISKRRQA